MHQKTIIGSDNGLAPFRSQAIIWTNAGILLIGPLGIKFNEILVVTNTFSFKTMHWKCHLENGSHFASASMCEQWEVDHDNWGENWPLEWDLAAHYPVIPKVLASPSHRQVWHLLLEMQVLVRVQIPFEYYYCSSKSIVIFTQINSAC